MQENYEEGHHLLFTYKPFTMVYAGLKTGMSLESFKKTVVIRNMLYNLELGI